MSIYLDNAATTPLTDDVKEYIISLLDTYQNPSSAYDSGRKTREIIEKARENVARFINTDKNNILFTSSGSASNTLAIKGLIPDHPFLNKYAVFYSSTAHKSMVESCKSCIYPYPLPLPVNQFGEIDIDCIDGIFKKYLNGDHPIPVVCVEYANSEIGSINDIVLLSNLVHERNGILIVDATGYIPYFPIDMDILKKHIDILTFSGHKLHSLKGVGVLYKRSGIKLKPLIYGTQENGIFAGTENVLGIASLGKAVEKYDYSALHIEPKRNYLYEQIIRRIPNCHIIGRQHHRLPCNLYMCFKGVEGESLMLLLDLNGIEVSTGSACLSGDLSPSPTLLAINMPEDEIHSCIRITLNGREGYRELDYVADKLSECVEALRGK